MRIGEAARADQLQDEVKRGETYIAEWDLYRNGQEDPACCEVEVGDPLDLRAYESMLIKGRVRGTDRELVGLAVFEAKGAVNIPARVSVFFSEDDLELCFAEGAEQSFTWQARATRPGERLSILCGTVDVIDSAEGAIRG